MQQQQQQLLQQLGRRHGKQPQQQQQQLVQLQEHLSVFSPGASVDYRAPSAAAVGPFVGSDFTAPVQQAGQGREIQQQQQQQLAAAVGTAVGAARRPRVPPGFGVGLLSGFGLGGREGLRRQGGDILQLREQSRAAAAAADDDADDDDADYDDDDDDDDSDAPPGAPTPREEISTEPQRVAETTMQSVGRVPREKREDQPSPASLEDIWRWDDRQGGSARHSQLPGWFISGEYTPQTQTSRRSTAYSSSAYTPQMPPTTPETADQSSVHTPQTSPEDPTSDGGFLSFPWQ